ncbi:hypothetical protein CRENBAI_010604, partial [Crenichthys baileyi]
DRSERVEDEEEYADKGQDFLSGDNQEPLVVNCKWRKTGASYYLILNSRVEIQFVSDRASSEGCLCLEPMHDTEKRYVTELYKNECLVEFYKPYGF